MIEVNVSSPVGRSAFRWFGLSGLWSIGFCGFLDPFKRQVQHRSERTAGLIGKCVYAERVSFGLRDYSAFRGFGEVGNRNCESFVGLDVGTSVRHPDHVLLLDRGFRFEVHEASRGGHDRCGHLGHRGYRDIFRELDRVGLVERVASGGFPLVLLFVCLVFVSSSGHLVRLREGSIVVAS